MQTNCDKCVFAIKKDIQTGCSLQRAEKLGIQDVEDGNYVLENFCNAFRPKEWLNELTLDEQLDAKAIVLNEVAVRMGFIIVLEDKEGAIERLQETLKNIRNQKDNIAAYVVVITDKVEYNEEIWQACIEILNEDTKYHIVQKIDVASHLVLDEAFGHAQNGWIYSTTAGESIPIDLIFKVNKMINIDMKKLLVVKSYDGTNGLMFPAYLFKFLNGNRAKIFQDEMVDTGSFMEKIETAAERSSPEFLIDWSQFTERLHQ